MSSHKPSATQEFLQTYNDPKVTASQQLFQVFVFYDMGLVSMERSPVARVDDLLRE